MKIEYTTNNGLSSGKMGPFEQNLIHQSTRSKNPFPRIEVSLEAEQKQHSLMHLSPSLLSFITNPQVSTIFSI